MMRECRQDGGKNKKKVYKMVVRPALMYALETVALTKDRRAELTEGFHWE